MKRLKYGVFVHSGVSDNFSRADLTHPAMLATIDSAKHGFDILSAKRTAIDAVEGAVMVMESSGSTNSGKGSVRQNDGRQRMDASIMTSSLQCGSVASLRGFENPIRIAKIISQDAHEHTFYAHDYAAQIAQNHGIPSQNDNNEQEILFAQTRNDGETVGAVALDFTGSLAAGTSTGGRGRCEPGRIGDSSIIGGGTYCNQIAAVSNTGFGEWIARLTCAKRIVDLIQFDDFSPQAAVDRMGIEYKHACDKTLGSICLDVHGRWGIGITGAAMRWAGVVQTVEDQISFYYGCAKGEIIKEERKN